VANTVWTGILPRLHANEKIGRNGRDCEQWLTANGKPSVRSCAIESALRLHKKVVGRRTMIEEAHQCYRQSSSDRPPAYDCGARPHLDSNTPSRLNSIQASINRKQKDWTRWTWLATRAGTRSKTCSRERRSCVLGSALPLEKDLTHTTLVGRLTMMEDDHQSYRHSTVLLDWPTVCDCETSRCLNSKTPSRWNTMRASVTIHPGHLQSAALGLRTLGRKQHPYPFARCRRPHQCQDIADCPFATQRYQGFATAVFVTTRPA
jgi:hypothetical protein